MRLKICAAFFALVLICALATPGAAQDLQDLLNDRTEAVWYEGEPLGDLIIGARAQFAFIFVDGKLAEAAWSDSLAPEWLKANTGFYGSRETRKKVLFIIRVRAIKNLSLELPMISIGDRQLAPEDLLTNKHFAPLGDLPAGITAEMAVAVPRSAVKGRKIRLSVGEYEGWLEMPR